MGENPWIIKWPPEPKPGEAVVAMAFRRIPAGEFRMGARGEYGDEEPMLRVRITREFWMGETPVTQAQFALWTGSPAYEAWQPRHGQKDRHANYFGDRPDHPAENLTWYQAVGYCDWLNATRLADLPTGFVARLPTEADWEYACRAGTDTEYCAGDGVGALEKVRWYSGNSGSSTQPVKQKAPNGWGLHDMHGNVWEWCRDAWYARPYRREERFDGMSELEWRKQSGEQEDTDRVVRGGSWINSARDCRSAIRFWWRPSIRSGFGGFRVCLVPGP